MNVIVREPTPIDERVVCEVCKKIVSVNQVVITRCQHGCKFMAVACYTTCDGFTYGSDKHHEHMRHLRDHNSVEVSVPGRPVVA